MAKSYRQSLRAILIQGLPNGYMVKIMPTSFNCDRSSEKTEGEQSELEIFRFLARGGVHVAPESVVTDEPRLCDYGITNSDVQAARESKKKSDTRRIEWFFLLLCLVIGMLWYAVASGLAGKQALIIFIGTLWFTILFCVVLFNVLESVWNTVWDVRHSNHHTTLAKYDKYTSDLWSYECYLERQREEFWKTLNGRQFELELAHLYSMLGYSIETTPYARDEGVDIHLTKNGQSILVQCKRHEKPVGVAVARELFGVLKDKRASSAILACTGGFTQGVVDFVRDKPVKLVGLKDIIAMQDSIAEAAKSGTDPYFPMDV